MEGFLRDNLKFMVCLWDRIWPPTAPLRTSNGQHTRSLPKVDVVTALYDFEARSGEELTVEAGEKLCKVSDEGDYIMARKLTGAMDMGLVPANYISPQGFTNEALEPDSPTIPSQTSHSDSQISEPWFVSVANRLEAERLLLSPPNAHGSFLIRPSDTNPGQYSLSVRNEGKVTHFRIRTTSTGEYYLQDSRNFRTLQELLNFHKTNWKLLKCPLLQPCVTEVLDPSGLQFDTWERPRSEFTLLRRLGQGFFGEVYEGLWNRQERVAIKTFKQDYLNRGDFEKEMNALKTLYHQNLIELLAVCSIGEPVYIVTELMTKGNLQEYLKGIDGKRLKTSDFIHIIRQVADGMEYLEMKHVVHRDLAARNVLVGENLICKIADFGLARLLKDDFYSPENNQTIPIRWTAPEALGYCKYSIKSDVWSFGILIYEVYTFGETPYKGLTNKEIFPKVSRGYRLPQPTNCSMDMYEVMLQCWDDNPQERPTFRDLAEQLYSMEEALL